MNPILDKLAELCGDNKEAADFIAHMWSFSQVWDNLVDGDKKCTAEAINGAMLWALFGIHDSPFYRKFEASLRPVIMHSVASWLTANKFEKSGDELRVEQAYFMRCARFDLFSTVILLVGGFQQQMKAIEFFRTLGPEDTLAKYKEEHLHGLL